VWRLNSLKIAAQIINGLGKAGRVYSLKRLAQHFLMGGCQHVPANKKQNEFAFKAR
jgi:hypothetical protein